MRIPDDILNSSKVASYGGGAMEFIIGLDEPGCPRRYHLRYIDPRPEEWSAPLQKGTVAHRALHMIEADAVSVDVAVNEVWDPQLGPEEYADVLRMLVDFLGTESGKNLHSVAWEIKLEIPLYTDEEFGPISLGGTLDRVAIDETAPRALVFTDYKSNQAPPTRAEFDQWIQGYFYAALLRGSAGLFGLEDGPVQIYGELAALRHYTMSRPYTDAEIDTFLAWAESVARKILRDDDPQPILNPGCDWCPVKYDCPAILALPEVGRAVLERIRNVDAAEQLAMRTEANELRLSLEKMVGAIDAVTKERLKVEDDRTLKTDGVSVALVPSFADRITNLAAIHELVGTPFYSKASFTKKALLELMSEHPDIAHELESLLVNERTGERLKWNIN